jgi:UDP-N-acetylglucosamine acyltransferase
MIAQDVVPYTVVQGDRAKTVGLNLIGLKRRGFSPEVLKTIKQAYRFVFRSNLPLEAALVKIEEELDGSPELSVFVDFIKKSERGLAR